jgi:hypothetical protein
MATFDSTYTQFLDELSGTFPEFASAITTARTLPDRQARFLESWTPLTSEVAAKNATIFTTAGVPLIPGMLMTASLWSELSAATHTALWTYLSSLLLLAASESKKELWDLSGFAHDMEEMMKNLKSTDGETPTLMKELFEKLGNMAKGFGMPDLSGATAGAAGAAAGKGFKIPERLFKGHIAKIAEELVKEFKPEDFGISPELLKSDDPASVFTYLQEVFTKKPELLMGAAQKIAKRIQAKFQKGEIKREDIIREAEELMKEFSENEAFSSMFGSLSEMMKMNEKESGSDGSARLRETRERMRKKQAEKAAAAATAAAGSGGNVIIDTAAVAAAASLRAAAEASLLLEAEEEKRASVPKSKKR